MLGKTYDAQVCSAARALEAVGERWSLLIVRDALYGGTTRFTDFRRSLGIATNVLAARLEGLVACGIMSRHRYSEIPESYEYLLTDKGRDLGPVIIALTSWGDRWAAPDGPPIRYLHAACGDEVRQRVLCPRCGPVQDPSDVCAQPGPGMPEELLARFAEAPGNL